MAAEEGMETPPQDLLLDLPVDVGAVEGGDRYRRRLERATTATSRGDRRHHFVGGHCYTSYDYLPTLEGRVMQMDCCRYTQK